MKKIILFFVLALTIFLIYNKVNNQEVIIPENAIRLRVIPNSNSSCDQAMKEIVKNYLEDNVYTLFKDTNNIDDARSIINNNIDNINYNIQNIFDNYNYNMYYDIKYGYNYFPEKEYKNNLYDAGYYESLVISIGDAKGDNYWCVLFPNLCVVDSKNVKYTSLIKKITSKVFSNK